jgi:ABC-type Mn2+/Zn2+ transport system permease subunit
MIVPQILHDLLFDYTLRTVALGAAVLGLVSGALGTFAVLRRQSLLGDAISHAALPGIVLAFMLTGSKAPLVLILGAAAAGWVGTLMFMGIVRSTRVPDDSALGIVLSVFFGIGLVLLTFVQQQPNAAQAGLDRFLFGQAATLLESDVLVLAALGAIAIAAVFVFWKEFKLLSFDREFGASLGFPIARNIPTGPSVVLAATAVVLVSLVLAPRRGLAWAWVRGQRNRRRIRSDAVLYDLLLLAGQHSEHVHGHRAEVIEAMGIGRGGVRRTLDVLEERALVRHLDDGTWALTDAGRRAALSAQSQRAEQGT